MNRLAITFLAGAVLYGAGLSGSARAAAANLLGPRGASVLPGYRLVDVGNPSSAGFGGYEAPVGFNNTGQIVGYADSAFGLYNLQAGSVCIAYTGKAFVNTAAQDDRGCFPSSGITDASDGTFETVGTLETFYSNSNVVAFVARVSGTKVVTTQFESNMQSRLQALNEHGISVGFSDYVPPLGFFSTQPPFYSNGTFIAPLQPQCKTGLKYCMSLVATTNGNTGGARSINASGTIVGFDAETNNTVMEYTIGKPASGVDFPAITANNGTSLIQVIGLDDAGNVYTWVQTGSYQQAYYYNVKTGKYRSLGTPFGANCLYLPSSVNASGEVIGLVHCQSGLYDYFSWTATGGLRRLNVANAPSESFIPIAVNDRGALLVQMNANNVNGPDWVIAYPSTSSKGIR